MAPLPTVFFIWLLAQSWAASVLAGRARVPRAGPGSGFLSCPASARIWCRRPGWRSARFMVDSVSRGTVGLDTAPLIYFIEIILCTTRWLDLFSRRGARRD